MTSQFGQWLNRFMGLWFVFSVILFFGTGAWALYRAGLPLTAAAALQPVYPFAVLLILAAAGLLKRMNAARALGIALCIWIFLSSIALAAPVPAELSVANVFRALPPGPWLAQPLLAGLLAALFALRSLRMYYSPMMTEAFLRHPPAPWKILLALVVVGASLATDLALPRPQRRPWPEAAAAPAPGEPKGTPAVPAALLSAGAALAAAQDLRGVKACKISLDETRLLLVTSDGAGHLVDLRTGKFNSYASNIETREWPESFTRPGADPIGPDADMYFDSDGNVVRRFTDPKFRYGIGGGANQFVSFTSTPNQIVVFNRDTKLLRRIEIPVGTVIWNATLDGEAKIKEVLAVASPDYAWLMVSVGQRSFVVHAREGRVIEVPSKGEEPKPAEFGPKWVRLNSAVHTLPTMVRKADLNAGAEEIVAYDDERGVTVTREGRLSFTVGGNLSLGSKPLKASVLNPSRYLALMQEGLSQINLVDLEKREILQVGKVHEGGFSAQKSCFTVSSTRRLFAAAHGTQTEIFWSAFVAAGNFRSVVLDLPVK